MGRSLREMVEHIADGITPELAVDFPPRTDVVVIIEIFLVFEDSHLVVGEQVAPGRRFVQVQGSLEATCVVK